MMQAEGTRMIREDRRELERNIKELEIQIIELGEDRRSIADTDIKDGLGCQIMTRLKELRRLRRLRRTRP